MKTKSTILWQTLLIGLLIMIVEKAKVYAIVTTYSNDTTIFSDITWQDTIVIESSTVRITNEARITIKPGSVVKFIYGGSLRVDSSYIVAKGKKNSPIIFQGDGTGQIELNSYGKTLSDSSIFEYCIFSRMSPVNNPSPFYINFYNPLKIENSKFNWNTGTYGGALNIYSSSPIIQNNLFVNNLATYGGAVSIMYGNTYLINNIIINNTSYFSAGAINLQADTTYLINNTIVNNFSDTAGIYEGNTAAIHISTDYNHFSSYAKFFNNIITGNITEGSFTIQVVLEGPSLSPSFLYNSIEGDTILIINNGSVERWYNNYERTPDFINPSLIKGRGVNESILDWRLKYSSNCINAGKPDFTVDSTKTAYDFEGKNRFIGDTIDIGAYEFDPLKFTLVPQISNMCLGDSVALVVATNYPSSKQWQKSSDGVNWVNIPYEQFDSLKFKGTSSGTYYFRCLAFHPFLGLDSTNAIVISVHPRPTATISGNATICEGGSSILTVAMTGSGPWNFSWSDGTNTYNETNVSTSPKTLLVSPTATTTYSLVSLSDANCVAQAGDMTGSATVTVHPRPTATISGNATICEGGSSILTVAMTGTGPWNFSWSDGMNTYNETNVSSSPKTLLVSPSATTTYSLVSLSDANCVAQAGDITGSATVTVNSLPVISVMPNDTTVTEGSSVTLTASGADSYNWSTGETTSSITFIANVTKTISVTGTTNGCNSSQQTVQVNVTPMPCLAEFSYTIIGDTLMLTSNAQNATAIRWVLNNEQFSEISNAKFILKGAGEYQICQQVFNTQTQCQSESCKKIIFKPGNFIKADFAYTITGNQVVFADSSSSTVNRWSWNFGEGSISSLQNPTHIYSQSGVYQVCLTVMSDNGLSSSVCKNLIIGNPPCQLAANFIYSVSGDTVKFINNTFGSGKDFWWDFGDRTSSSLQNPYHIYPEDGIYKVTFSVLDSQQCLSQVTRTLKLGRVLCVADFDYLAENNNNVIQFINQSQGDNLKYFWSFSNKGYSQLKNPNFDFKNKGTYKVSLTVIDNLSKCVNRIEKDVVVDQAPCYADFVYFIDSLTNTITCEAKNKDTGNQYRWLFGDGSVSKNSKAVYMFNKSGVYDVQLTVFNSSKACIQSSRQSILVGKANGDYKPNFVYYPASSNPLTIQFSDITRGKIDKRFWNFGDNSQLSTDSSITHVFNAAGVYNVCLGVIQSGVPGLICQKIWVGNEASWCVADFNYFTDSINNKKVSFINTSGGNVTSYLWNFGNGALSSTKDPSITYNQTGYYPVLLLVRNTQCTDYTLQLVNAGEIPRYKVAFAFLINGFSKKAGGYPVDFIGAGLGDEVRIKWTFGDGSVDTTTNSPTHVYQEPGTYEVCYEMSDPITGASDKVCQQITITGIRSINENIVNIYPVPFEKEFWVKLSRETGNFTISLTDLSGRIIIIPYRMIQTDEGQLIRFDATQLKRGSYLIKISAQGQNYTRLIIKQ
ncbi:MAG: PKD domain-containing protein [Bacteroidales bacterium]|nr:PKD domain-containing protein [Bacteroidales bacterium]